MKRKLVFLIIIGICFAGLAALFAGSFLNGKGAAQKQPIPGEYRLSPSESIIEVDDALSGEWEYYPGELLISGDSVAEHPGILEPYFFWSEKPPAEKPIVVNENARHIRVPGMAFSSLLQGTVSVKKASYRMVVQNIRNEDSDTLMLVLPGLVKGNYKVFLNGHETLVRMPSPWAYPIYKLESSPTQEIVIEITGTSDTLSVIPRICFLGTAMTDFDVLKDIFTVAIAMIFAALLTLIISFFTARKTKISLMLLVGIFLTVAFFLDKIWISGYLTDISKLLPTLSLSALPQLFILLGMIVFCVNNRLHLPSVFSAGYTLVHIVLIVASGALHFMALFAFSGIFRCLEYLLLFALLIHWCVLVYKNIDAMQYRDLLLQYGGVSLCVGVAADTLYGFYRFNYYMLFIMPFCIVLFLGILIYSIQYFHKESAKQQAELLALERDVNRVQMAFFSTQIQPHFLYNTLNTIQEKCYTNPRIAAEMIVHFSKYLRTNIDFMSYKELVPFSTELEHIDNYIYIQKIRFDQELIFEKKIDFEDFSLPPLSVQPLVENAVKHGIRAQKGAGSILLETQKKDGYISIKVSNSGTPFSENDIRESHSLDNIRKRLKTIQQGELLIYSDAESNRTTVEIRIPAEAAMEGKAI